MKNLLLLLRGGLLALLPLTTLAQSVGIGTATPDAKAALDIRATDKGLLVPRLSAGQRAAIAAPPQGLLVFQTDGTATGGAGTGFWYFGGSPAAWVFLNPAGGGADNLGNGVATTPVNLQGNALVGTGASVGTAVGVGVRADGGLNLGQNGVGNNVLLGYQAGQSLTPNVVTRAGSYNLLLGHQAGQATTTGRNNQFSGYRSGYSNTTGSQNLFSGAFSGYTNTTGGNNLFSGTSSGAFNTTGSNNLFNGAFSGFVNETGSDNLFSGYLSGYRNTTGRENLFSGTESGYSNTTGSNNLFSGYRSGYNNTTGSFNQFSGTESGYRNTTGSLNIFLGYHSGYSNTTGIRNLFSGSDSGTFNTTGSNNLFNGSSSGFVNETGSDNVFSGAQSGYNNTAGSSNVFSGAQSGYNNTAGSSNVFNGYQSGYRNTTGRFNVFSGYQSGLLSTTGSDNVFIGYQSGIRNTTGSLNIALGDFAGPASGALQNTIALGAGATVSRSNSLALGGEGVYAVRVGIGTGAPSFALDVVGVVRCFSVIQTSDARLKQAVRPLAGALAGVGRLRGVRYTFRQAAFKEMKLPAGEQLGLLAQEVEKVYPELVSTDPQGYKAVNYAQLTPVLIEAIKELKAENDALRGQQQQDREQLGQFEQRWRLDRAAAQAQAAGFAQRLQALEAAGAQAAAGR